MKRNPILVLLYGFILLGFLLCHPVRAAPFQLTLDRADVSVTLQGQTTPMSLGIKSLPWRWDSEFNRQSGTTRFVFQFNIDRAQWQYLQEHEAGLGLSAINIGNRYRFRLNQGAWTEVGWLETTQYRARPRWHLIPCNQLSGSWANTLELEVKYAPASESGLSKISLGAVANSLEQYQTASHLRYFSAILAGVSSLLVGLLAIAIWWASRERFFIYTGLAEFIFALRQTGVFIDYPPLSTWIWNGAYASFYAAYVGFVCLASQLLLPEKTKLSKRVTIFLWWYLALSLLALTIGNWLGDYHVYQICLVVMMAVTLFCVTQISLAAWRIHDLNLRLFAFAAWFAMLLSFYDFVAIQLVADGLGKFRFGVFSSILFNLSVAVIIVRRYLLARRDVMRSRFTAKIEAERATMQERQRIMSDIHDTVGSQLVSVLGMIRGGAPRNQLAAETSGALEDLRIAIDAIQPVNGSLTAVLATLRHRLEPRIDAAGLTLRWHVESLPRVDSLTPQMIQHMQRIVLEVISNSLAHAHANIITVSAKAMHDANGIQIAISIADDGVGFEPTLLNSQGQGLRNIQMRADAIQAKVAIYPHLPCGTMVTLTLRVA